jgi:altronate dehydratase
VSPAEQRDLAGLVGLHRENMDILTDELRGAKARHRRDLLELHQAASAAGVESIVERIDDMLEVVHMDKIAPED